MVSVVIAQLPSPPFKNVFREWAGGMGTTLSTTRSSYGHDQQYYDIPYFSFLYIASSFEQQNISYKYLDFQSKESYPLQEIYDELFDCSPQVLVTVINLPTLNADLDLLQEIKQQQPALKIIVLGPSAKWYKQRILTEGVVDIIMEGHEENLTVINVSRILNNSELALADLDLQGVSFLSYDKVVTTPTRDQLKNLNFIDFPAYHLLDFKRYESDFYFNSKYRYATVFTAKGCPYSCGYCPYPFGFGDKLIYRSPEKVVDDIERLINEFGVKQILFRDQVFTMNKKHASAVCNEIIARKLDVVWICETRYDIIDFELMELMYQAGCRELHYGLESADEELFAKVAKVDGPKSLDLFKQVISWTKQAGIQCHVHMIVGMPDESAQSLKNTTKWLREAKPGSVQVAYYVPYPGTPFWEELKSTKVLGDVEQINWDEMSSFDRPVVATKHLSIEQLRKATDRMKVDWQFTFLDRIENKIRRMLGMQIKAAK